MLAAHVTLFHALPYFCADELREVLARLAASTPPPPARLTGLMDLGRGTALRFESAALLALREEIAARFHGMLTEQDSHPPRLHATIQNKVTRPEARALQQALAPAILPQDFTFRAVALHRYLGGPWESAGRWPFRG